MKKIKNIFFSMLMIVVATTSCTKTLDLAPEDYFGDGNFWQNESQVNNFTGIQSEKGVEEISVFPNPANQFIIITTNPEMAGKGYFLTDAMGIIVYRGILTNEINSIDISNFRNGPYYLVFLENGGFNIKIIKI